MTDIKKKAIEYAEQIGRKYEYDGRENIAKQALLAGAAYALGNQWRDAEKEKPTHNHLVLVDVGTVQPDFRFTAAYYRDGIWIIPDEFYYDSKVLAWLEIPERKPKGE